MLDIIKQLVEVVTGYIFKLDFFEPVAEWDANFS